MNTLNFLNLFSDNNEFLKIGNVLSVFASFFDRIGDEKNCINLWEIYIKLIEKLLGGENIHTSNAYFVLGVHFLQKVKIFSTKYYII